MMARAMVQRLLLFLLALILAGVGGCRQGSPNAEEAAEEPRTIEEIRRQAHPYLIIFRDRIKAEEELAAILARVRDAATMKMAQRELQDKYQRFEAIKAKAKALPPPQGDVQAFLQIEVEEGMQRAQMETRREVQRILQLPGGKEFLNAMTPQP